MMSLASRIESGSALVTVDAVKLRAQAAQILRANAIEDVAADGSVRRYTVPTQGLYPHQWNWDSAICAIGMARIDPDRAFAELESLLAAQDADGLVPHIAFNPAAVSYQPGPDWWGSRAGGDGRLISCISQPPVAAMALRRVFELSPEVERARPLLEPLQSWHDWFLSVRDPDGRGEPVLVHPWETGRDNAVEWDLPLLAAPQTQAEFQRVDTGFVSAEQRPTKAHYQHYIGLVEQFRDLRWNQMEMAKNSAFRVIDPGFSAIFARACADLAEVAIRCGDFSVSDRATGQSEQIAKSIDARRDVNGRAWPIDLSTGAEIRRHSVALGFQLLQPDLAGSAAAVLAADCVTGSLASNWGVCSTAPSDPDFDPVNYWRGPVWASSSWLVAAGLRLQQRNADASRLEERLLRAVSELGFSEYFHASSGLGLGGGNFSWTAAVTLELLPIEQLSSGAD